jgi:hypothetical protein
MPEENSLHVAIMQELGHLEARLGELASTVCKGPAVNVRQDARLLLALDEIEILILELIDMEDRGHR